VQRRQSLTPKRRRNAHMGSRDPTPAVRNGQVPSTSDEFPPIALSPSTTMSCGVWDGSDFTPCFRDTYVSPLRR
jgi:hypothetical protein